MGRTPELRRVARTRMICGGRMVAEERSQACVVLDLSATGARIHLLHPEAAPSTAVLHLPGGVVRKAARRWQRDDIAGYEFCEPA
ncbi:hypothetical protein [Sabulicella rubraurantiaca]|uniref:hypothetical protein n=1 Tax=Sabulicella rubraurantiaca TaxID=2811429 RepID=UPI001A96D6DD|nr:hypothetical protein [Sabulicella rubraurantiaca]